MKKRIMALVSAVVLTLAMGTTALAAGSNGAGVTTSDPEVTVAATTEAAPVLTDAAVSSILTAAGLTPANCTVLTTFELTGTVKDPVVLNVAAVTASTKLVVLHKVNGAWTKENATAGNGTVTITGLTSYSPFAIVVDKTTVSSTSPKTGEASTVAVVSLVALLACSAAFFARKKNA